MSRPVPPPLAAVAVPLAALVLPALALPAVTSWAQVVNLVQTAVIVVLLVLVVRRRRLLSGRGLPDGVDDVEVLQTLRVLLAAVPGALYAYDRDGVYTWSDVGETFPLDWRRGALVGLLYTEAVPQGPEGDEARTAYVRVLRDRLPTTYTRRDTGPSGRTATVSYHHAPTPGGGGVCFAYDVSVLADRCERATEEAARLRTLLDRAESRMAAMRAQARSERALTIRRADPEDPEQPPGADV